MNQAEIFAMAGAVKDSLGTGDLTKDERLLAEDIASNLIAAATRYNSNFAPREFWTACGLD